MLPDRHQLWTVEDVSPRAERRLPLPLPYRWGDIRWRSGDIEDWLNGLQTRRY